MRSLMAIAFLLFAVPRGHVWYTAYAEKTMYVYLLQMAFLNFCGPLLGRLLTPWPWVPANVAETERVTADWITAAICVLGGWGVTWLLTTSPIVLAFGWAIEPAAWIDALTVRLTDVAKRYFGTLKKGAGESQTLLSS